METLPSQGTQVNEMENLSGKQFRDYDGIIHNIGDDCYIMGRGAFDDEDIIFVYVPQTQQVLWKLRLWAGHLIVCGVQATMYLASIVMTEKQVAQAVELGLLSYQKPLYTQGIPGRDFLQ